MTSFDPLYNPTISFAAEDRSLEDVNALIEKLDDLGGKVTMLGLGFKVTNGLLDIAGKRLGDLSKASVATTKNLNQTNLAAGNLKGTVKGLGDVLDNLEDKMKPFVQGAFIVKGLSIIERGFQGIANEVNRVNEAIKTLNNNGVDPTVISQFENLELSKALDPQAASNLAQSGLAQFNRFTQAQSLVNTLASRDFISQGARRAGVTEASLTPELSNRFRREQSRQFGIDIQRLVGGDLRNSITSTDALQGSALAIGGGFNVGAEANQVLSAGSKLAASTGTGTPQTLDLLVKTMKAYGIEASEAAETSGKLYAILDKGITTVDELSQGFGRTATVAKQAGIDLDNLGASVAELTKKGTSTDTALSGLQTLSSVIISGSANDFLRQYGVTLDKVSVQANGLIPQLQKVYEAVGQNTTNLRTALPDALAFQTALGLVGENAKSAGESLEYLAKTGADRLEEVFNIKIEEDKLLSYTRLVNKLVESLINIGRAVAESGVIDKGIAALDKYADRIEKISTLYVDGVVKTIEFNLQFQQTINIIKELLGIVTGLAGAWLSYRLVTGDLIGDMFRIITTFTKTAQALDVIGSNKALSTLSWGYKNLTKDGEKAFDAIKGFNDQAFNGTTRLQKFGAVLGQIFGLNSLEKLQNKQAGIFDPLLQSADKTKKSFFELNKTVTGFFDNVAQRGRNSRLGGGFEKAGSRKDLRQQVMGQLGLSEADLLADESLIDAIENEVNARRVAVRERNKQKVKQRGLSNPGSREKMRNEALSVRGLTEDTADFLDLLDVDSDINRRRSGIRDRNRRNLKKGTIPNIPGGDSIIGFLDLIGGGLKNIVGIAKNVGLAIAGGFKVILSLPFVAPLTGLILGFTAISKVVGTINKSFDDTQDLVSKLTDNTVKLQSPWQGLWDIIDGIKTNIYKTIDGAGVLGKVILGAIEPVEKGINSFSQFFRELQRNQYLDLELTTKGLANETDMVSDRSSFFSRSLQLGRFYNPQTGTFDKVKPNEFNALEAQSLANREKIQGRSLNETQLAVMSDKENRKKIDDIYDRTNEALKTQLNSQNDSLAKDRERLATFQSEMDKETDKTSVRFQSLKSSYDTLSKSTETLANNTENLKKQQDEYNKFLTETRSAMTSYAEKFGGTKNPLANALQNSYDKELKRAEELGKQLSSMNKAYVEGNFQSQLIISEEQRNILKNIVNGNSKQLTKENKNVLNDIIKNNDSFSKEQKNKLNEILNTTGQLTVDQIKELEKLSEQTGTLTKEQRDNLENIVTNFNTSVTNMMQYTDDQLSAGFISIEQAQTRIDNLVKNSYSLYLNSNKEFSALIAKQRELVNKRYDEEIEKLDRLKSVYSKYLQTRIFATNENFQREKDMTSQQLDIRLKQAEKNLELLRKAGGYSKDMINKAQDAIRSAKQDIELFNIQNVDNATKFAQQQIERRIEVLQAGQSNELTFRRDFAEQIRDLNDRSQQKEIQSALKVQSIIKEKYGKNSEEFKNATQKVELEFERLRQVRLRNLEETYNEEVQLIRRRVDVLQSSQNDELMYTMQTAKKIRELNESAQVVDFNKAKGQQDLIAKLYGVDSEAFKRAEQNTTVQANKLKEIRIKNTKATLDEEFKLFSNGLEKERLILEQRSKLTQRISGELLAKEIDNNERIIKRRIEDNKRLLEIARRNGADTLELQNKIVKDQVDLINSGNRRILEIIRNARQVAERPIEFEVKVLGIESMSQLLDARSGFIGRIKDLYDRVREANIGNLEKAMELENSETKKFQLAQKIAKLKQDSLQEQLNLEKELFELEVEKNKLALEKRKLDQEALMIQKTESLRAAQEREKSILNDTTKSEREKKDAVLLRQRAERELDVQGRIGGLLNQEGSLQDRLTFFERQLFDRQQNNKRFDVDLERARLTPGINDDVDLLNRLYNRQPINLGNTRDLLNPEIQRRQELIDARTRVDLRNQLKNNDPYELINVRLNAPTKLDPIQIQKEKDEFLRKVGLTNKVIPTLNTLNKDSNKSNKDKSGDITLTMPITINIENKDQNKLAQDIAGKIQKEVNNIFKEVETRLR